MYSTKYNEASPRAMNLRKCFTITATMLAMLASVPAAAAFVTYQSNVTTARRFLVSQVQTPQYPYTVHLPDRTTRNLAPLTTPPPMLLCLSGSGARGPGNESAILSGYDGASRKIRQYNAGERTLSHLLAAEEFLTVTPVCPVNTPQSEANWNVSALPRILAEVAQIYQVDLNRVYLSTYSMGTRAAWDFLMQYPNIFAGAILSSGATHVKADAFADIVGIPIRNFVGSVDENGLEAATATAMANYDAAYAAAQANGTVSSTSGRLDTIVVPGGDHLTMTDRPWDNTTMVDGYTGALAWLITQQRPQPAQIPGLDLTDYATAQNASSSDSLGAAVTSSAANSSSADATGGALKSIPSQGLLGLVLNIFILHCIV